jgi:hypothetical protein
VKSWKLQSRKITSKTESIMKESPKEIFPEMPENLFSMLRHLRGFEEPQPNLIDEAQRPDRKRKSLTANIRNIFKRNPFLTLNELEEALLTSLNFDCQKFALETGIGLDRVKRGIRKMVWQALQELNERGQILFIENPKKYQT